MQQIVIKKAYFDNIKVAVDAMNKFFASGFKMKTFPVINDDFQVDRIVARTLSWLNNIEPSWMEDPKAAVETLDKLKDYIGGQPAGEPVSTTEADEVGIPTPALTDANSPWKKIFSNEDKVATDKFHAFIGFKMLQYIANNFDQFDQLMNGVYTFELFTKPSQYRSAIDTFTKPIPLEELNQIAPFPGEYKLFDSAEYVGSIFANDQIKLPEGMEEATEVQRFNSYTDLADTEVVVDDTVQEAATVDYFSETKPAHIIYDAKTKKWKISKQFEAAVNKLLSAIRKCDTSDDLLEVFNKTEMDVDMFTQNVIPAILLRVFNNPKKYPFESHDAEAVQKYAKSYVSIVKKNKGAVRFERLDLFSTFKSDKEGTLKFLEDFLKLNLVNNSNATIENNTLLTVFNIFDSRIYFDILFNVASGELKDYSNEDEFVKAIRSQINQNSHVTNPYAKKEKPVTNALETSDEVSQESMQTVIGMKDLTLTDMVCCEEFLGAVYDEIDTLGDALYNAGTSAILVDHYIGESHVLFQEGVLKNMKEKSKKNRIIKIEKALQAHLPEEFILLIDNPPKKNENPRYLKGNGYLGILFNWADIEGGVNSSSLSKFMKQNQILMFSEFYDTDTLQAEFDVDKIKVLWLNLKDNSVMISDNPFNLDNFFMSDLKKFEPSISALLDNLDEWTGKPSVGVGGKSDDDADLDDEGDDEDITTEYEVVHRHIYTDGKKKKGHYVQSNKGEIPDYLKNRMGLNEDETQQDPDKKKSTTVTDVQLPPDLVDNAPTNDIDDLADSVNTRMNTPGAEGLEDMLGTGYQGPIGKQGGQGHVVYNITNNYSNSHNTSTVTSDDHSTGKTTKSTTTTTTTSNDLSSNKQTNAGTHKKASNNYDNTRPSSNSKDDDSFSNGKSVQEVFALLTSEEPLFVESDAGKPPKGNMLTSAMDADMATLSAQQKLKRGAQNVRNGIAASAKPVTRSKQWMKSMIDSLIKRDEDQVKAEMIENPSYRSAVYKAARIALKAGKFAIFSAISPYLGAAYLGVQGLKLADRERLRNEANQEIATEIQIIDKKIEYLQSQSRYGEANQEAQNELYKLLRIRQKLLDASTNAHKRKLQAPSSVY